MAARSSLSLTSTTENNAVYQRFRSLDGIKDTVPSPQKAVPETSTRHILSEKGSRGIYFCCLFSCIYSYRNSGRSHTAAHGDHRLPYLRIHYYGDRCRWKVNITVSEYLTDVSYNLLYLHHNEIRCVWQWLRVKIFRQCLYIISTVEAIIPPLPHIRVQSLLHILGQQGFYKIAECNNTKTFVKSEVST